MRDHFIYGDLNHFCYMLENQKYFFDYDPEHGDYVVSKAGGLCSDDIPVLQGERGIEMFSAIAAMVEVWHGAK